MRYDPFAAHNLVRAFSLAGLFVMMTEVVPGTACLAIGLLCLAAAAILSAFSGPAEMIPKASRPAAARRTRSIPAARPQLAARSRHIPAPGPGKPGIEPHPAIFGTVAGRSTGLSSSRRRD